VVDFLPKQRKEQSGGGGGVEKWGLAQRAEGGGPVLWCLARAAGGPRANGVGTRVRRALLPIDGGCCEPVAGCCGLVQGRRRMGPA
jgi:hypothetical protein